MPSVCSPSVWMPHFLHSCVNHSEKQREGICLSMWVREVSLSSSKLKKIYFHSVSYKCFWPRLTKQTLIDLKYLSGQFNLSDNSVWLRWKKKKKYQYLKTGLEGWASNLLCLLSQPLTSVRRAQTNTRANTERDLSLRSTSHLCTSADRSRLGKCILHVKTNGATDPPLF